MTYDEVRDAARAKLDDAIREYAAALFADRPEIIGVGGWNCVVFAAHTEEGSSSYLTESAPGQPWHASIGILRYGVRFYEGPELES